MFNNASQWGIYSAGSGAAFTYNRSSGQFLFNGKADTATTATTATNVTNALGVGQTWQSVSRSPGTTYTNSTGKPIMVNVFSSLGANIYVDGVLAADGGGGSGDQVTISAIVPNGSSYVINGSFSVSELR